MSRYIRITYPDMRQALIPVDIICLVHPIVDDDASVKTTIVVNIGDTIRTNIYTIHTLDDIITALVIAFEGPLHYAVVDVATGEYL